MCTHYQCFYHRLALSNVLCKAHLASPLISLINLRLLQTWQTYLVSIICCKVYTIEMVINSPHSIITNPILLKMKHYGQIVTSVT